jgi:hypothetical protein
MLGKSSAQRGLFSPDNLYLHKIKKNTLYHFLGEHRHEIFRDEDYASLYSPSNGRPSVPPSVLAAACLLQAYCRASDEEAVERATFDMRWAVALGIEVVDQPFAKSTLQEFRAKLLLNDKAMAIYQRSLSYARERGHLKNKKMKVALDTTHILGKGAVKDTYNLLADGIKKLYQCLAPQAGQSIMTTFKEKFKRYFGKSFKGEANINWDDETARRELLNVLSSDARALLDLAQETIATIQQSSTTKSAAQRIETIRQTASLLSSVLLQDLETKAGGQVDIKQGVAKDRIVSTNDVEMRHGRKSASQRFDGHKAAIATDTESLLITAIEVVPGNVHDSETATALVDASERNTGNAVEVAIGDCAFGTAAVREQFEHRDTELIAKIPKAPQRDHFTKHDFTIDLENNQVTCPAGQATTTYRSVTVPFGPRGERRTVKQFHFADAECAACRLREHCILSKAGGGRKIQLHPREDLLQQARLEATTDHFKEHYRQRVVVEHSIARLAQRGIRKSRYVGRRRTLWQLALAAAVVNLMLIAAKERSKKGDSFCFWMSLLHLAIALLDNSRLLAHPAPEFRRPARRADFLRSVVACAKIRAFRPDF